MLLGAALQELKIHQSKLVRLSNLRYDTFNYLENKTIEVPFDDLNAEIQQLMHEIRNLKVRIHKTNSNSMLEVEGTTMSIQELIILIGDLRSELSRLESLRPQGPVYLGGQAVEYLPQKKKDEMAAMISEVEQRKADLDKLLQAKNWATELLE